MRELTLSRGYVARVDDEDFDWLSQWRWYGAEQPKVNVVKVYAIARIGDRMVRMHRLISGAPSHLLTDHRDGDTLNNQRSNLRICTASQNAANLRTTDAASGYKGVTYEPISNPRRNHRELPWRARIHADGQSYELGYFLTAEEAAMAYDTAAIGHFGEFAATNASLGLLKTERSVYCLSLAPSAHTSAECPQEACRR